MSRPQTARAAAAAFALAAITGCAEDKIQVPFAWYAAHFNEHIRADFQPLTPQDLADDARYGFFRDGSGGGLVSEVFPVSAAAPSGGTGGLVKAPCLFVGGERGPRGELVASDELRLVWEMVGYVDVETGLSEPDSVTVDDLFARSGSDRLGLCSLSTPVNRLLFEDLTHPVPNDETRWCNPEANGLDLSYGFTIDEDSRNVPLRCVVGHAYHEVRLQAFTPDKASGDGACPVDSSAPVDPALPVGRPAHFDGPAADVTPAGGASGWFADDHWSVCGYSPNHVMPSGDASYRLSLKDGHSFGSVTPQRWLSPNIMMVSGERAIVRPLTPSAPDRTTLEWHTAVERNPSSAPPPAGEGSAPPAEPSVRWAENFTPTVLVQTVEILSRGADGTERIEEGGDQAYPTLQILIPRPRPAAAATLTCTSRTTAWRFAVPDDCGTLDDPGLGVLTPTYATAFLHDANPVTTPITWSAAPEGLEGRTPFIRFGLRAAGQPAAMRISPIRDFGELQQGRWREGEVVLENIGGPPVEVRSIGFATGSAHPGDFSFVVVGDPVQVPLPIEANPDGNGGSALRLTDDAADAPIVTLSPDGKGVRLALGDPLRGPAAQPLTIYGQPARLVGGLLIRDDPTAVFTPTLASGARPFTVSAFAERTMPFVLGSGAAVKIAVIAQPTGLGLRSALLRVDAVAVGAPATPLQATASLRVDSRQGPQLHLAPSTLWFNKAQGETVAQARRAAMIDNVGSFDLDVTRIRIQGRDAARFSLSSARGAPPLRLSPGGYADLWITYTPECDGSYGTGSSLVDHEAVVVIESASGVAELPLTGASYGFCELP
jgi:hypothetical protein